MIINFGRPRKYIVTNNLYLYTDDETILTVIGLGVPGQRDDLQYKYICDENGNWEIALLSDLQVAFDSNSAMIDIFCVGGGGGGAYAGGGGGGGYTTNLSNFSLQANFHYPIVIGAGGGGGISSHMNGYDGSSTSFSDLCIAVGGLGGSYNTNTSRRYGGNGGSGGGGYCHNATTSHQGGTNGGDGESSTSTGGNGQGITTIPFNGNGTQLTFTYEVPTAYTTGGGFVYTTYNYTDAVPFSGGGGGGTYNQANFNRRNGGAIGGGVGGYGNSTNGTRYPSTAGLLNTGGGGGGGGSGYNASTTGSTFSPGSAGGSGIVLLRNSRN